MLFAKQLYHLLKTLMRTPLALSLSIIFYVNIYSKFAYPFMVGKIFQIYGYCILLKNALASQKNENRYFYPKNDIFTHAPAGSYHQICL